MDISLSEALGTVGVTLLLVGFFLNLFGLIRRQSLNYLTLNLVGAGLACYASFLIEFFPFVLLEGTWTAVAVVALVKMFRDRAASVGN